MPPEAARERIANRTLASIDPLDLNGVEKKGRTEGELLEVLCRLADFTRDDVHEQIEEETTFEGLFEAAKLHPNASLAAGVIHGDRVEEIEDSRAQEARQMDELVDELAPSSPATPRLGRSRAAPPIRSGWRGDAMARPAGFEPATLRLGSGCSIQLSYGRSAGKGNGREPPRPRPCADPR